MKNIIKNFNPQRIVMTLFLVISSTATMAAEPATGTSTLNDLFGVINGYLAAVFFYDVMPGSDNMPFIVAWLIVGAVFLTIRMNYINLRMFRHAYHILRGKYAAPDTEGEVTSFQALTTALSATVGLGNIAGVAIAIMIGGPGATFWMIVAGFLGMTSKFTEATLAQMYREVRPDGHIMGGAMEYLSRGLAEKGWARTGKVLAIIFSVLTIGGSLGAGNAFQVSQSLTAVKLQIPLLVEYPWIYGVVMATMVAVVIIGGIRRIAHTAEAIVPSMVSIYVLACIWIILSNAAMIPDAVGKIMTEAFTPAAGVGGLIGVLVQGFKRAAFSSEAGIGSAAIAHATAKVAYPVRQGIVALMEPFIDTIVICTMTALVIIITGVYNSPETAELVANKEGAALTAVAFGSAISWFPIILSVSVVLFAYSTMISWSYYGERCWTYMFGESSTMAYRIIFVMFVVIGSVTSASNILDFSDLLILGMALPNFIGLYVLHGKVKDALSSYLAKLKSGELDREVQ
ncbi:MAG: alanine/glycine:cation symporter family protein [Gammaproteobacteria bacterium]|nr:MAG: alanine/glycine:cation symporter family protein [Gammaproteobacteria bacterium]